METQSKILIVEDEISLQETLAYNLQKEGYLVKAVDNGNAALTTARRFKPNLIIMDLMLPGIDGLEVTRILRQEMTVPILMLTARDEEIDRVIGLEIGADDYITKPFSMRELIARIKAHLRRIRLIHEEFTNQSTHQDQTLVFGNLKMNLSSRQISINDKTVEMKPKEFELLYCLAKHKGQALTRKHLLEEVWGWDFYGGSRTVDVHIRWLRQKIEKEPANPTRIVTVRGIGYRFDG